MFQPSKDGSPLPFDASLDITFNVTAPTSCVVLNARGLNFSSVAVGATAVCSSAEACIGDGDAVSAPFVRYQAVQGSDGPRLVSTGDEDLVALDLGTAQLTGESNVLSLRFTGLLGSIVGGGETGLLRSRSFVPLGGKASQVLVATQGAQNGGRRILPCYDQPRFKAVFKVSVQASAAVAAGVLGAAWRSGSRMQGAALPCLLRPPPLWRACLVHLRAQPWRRQQCTWSCHVPAAAAAQARLARNERGLAPCKAHSPPQRCALPASPQAPASVKQVLSNGRCVQTRTLDAAQPTLRTWACDNTPVMSTYLLALAAGSIDEVPSLDWQGRLPTSGVEAVDAWAEGLQARPARPALFLCLVAMPGGQVACMPRPCSFSATECASSPPGHECPCHPGLPPPFPLHTRTPTPHNQPPPPTHTGERVERRRRPRPAAAGQPGGQARLCVLRQPAGAGARGGGHHLQPPGHPRQEGGHGGEGAAGWAGRARGWGFRLHGRWRAGRTPAWQGGQASASKRDA